jgi:hypothetical protein
MHKRIIVQKVRNMLNSLFLFVFLSLYLVLMIRNYRKTKLKRYELCEDIQLLHYGKLRYLKLQDWISLYPDIVYYHIYLPGKLELVKITLTSNAYVEFKKCLAKMFPDLFKQMIIKQLKQNQQYTDLSSKK